MCIAVVGEGRTITTKACLPTQHRRAVFMFLWNCCEVLLYMFYVHVHREQRGEDAGAKKVYGRGALSLPGYRGTAVRIP